MIQLIPGDIVGNSVGGVFGAIGPMIGVATFILPFFMGAFIVFMLLNGWYPEGIRIAFALFRKKTLLTLYDGSGNEQTWPANKTTPDSIYFLHPKTKRNFKLDRSLYDKHGYTIIANKNRRYHHFTWALPSDPEQLMRITQIVGDIRCNPGKFPLLSKFKHDDEITESLTTEPVKLEKVSQRWARRYRTLKLERTILNVKTDGTVTESIIPVTDLAKEFKEEVNLAWDMLQKDFLRAGPVDMVGAFNAMSNPIAPETLNDMETISMSNKGTIGALASAFGGSSFGPMIVGAIVGIILVKMSGA
jgi:hypothetical protein